MSRIGALELLTGKRKRIVRIVAYRWSRSGCCRPACWKSPPCPADRGVGRRAGESWELIARCLRPVVLEFCLAKLICDWFSAGTTGELVPPGKGLNASTDSGRLS